MFFFPQLQKSLLKWSPQVSYRPYPFHFLLEGVNDELEERIILFLLLGKLLLGLASPLPQLCQNRVVGLLLLLGLPLPVGQVLKRKHRTVTWYINSYKGKPLHLMLCDEVQGCDYILVHTKEYRVLTHM